MTGRGTSRPSTDPPRRPDERGQATLEFTLAMLLLLAAIAAFYQALHFELDVFNRISLLRYRVMNEAHRDQPTTKKSFDRETMHFRPVARLMPMQVPLQTLDPLLAYGPKAVHFRKGTRYADPTEGVKILGRDAFHDTAPLFAILSATEQQESTSGTVRRIAFASSPYWILAFPDPDDQ